MNVGKIVDVSGKKYIAIYDHGASGEYLVCRNCAFFEHAACASIDDCIGVIFKPHNAVEPVKYTVADFVEAFSAVVYAMPSNRIARVSDYLEKKHKA